MTRISTIHGIPFGEYAGRSDAATAQATAGYFPYLSMTAGQLELALLLQRAQMFQRFAPDMPIYSRSADMLQKALRAGPSGVNYTGIVPDQLQSLAQTIKQANRRTQPASRAAYVPVQPRVGAPIIPLQQRYETCVKEKVDALPAYIKNDPFRLKEYRQKIEFDCRKQFSIEEILNNGIEKSGHHLVYKSLPNQYALPADVRTKRILHQTGVEGMALVGEIPADLMYLWVENGIIQKNLQQKIGPLSSAVTSIYLAPDPEQAVDQFRAWLNNQPPTVQDRVRNGAAIQGINIGPITAGVIIAIAGALTAAANMLTEMRKQKAYAMVQAQGFGTQAFSGTQNDWLSPGATGGGSGLSMPLLLLLGGGLLLLNDKN